MKRILAIMLLLSFLLLTFVACGGKDGETTNPDSTINNGNNNNQDNNQDNNNQGNNNSNDKKDPNNGGTNKTATLGFVFELNEDGNGYIITDYMGGEVDICIPSTYNNLPVTEIDSNAFNSVRDTLVSVCYADNMQLDEIVCWCFDDCVNLKSVIIPDGVTYISYNSFINCTSLESITIPDSVQRIGDSAFAGCINLNNIYIGENSSLQEISGSAFDECEKLKFNEYSNALYLGNESNPYTILYKAKSTVISSCSINEKTRTILDGAFSGCSGISQITIPDSVEFIGLNVFSGCEGLTYNTYDNAYYIGSESNPYFMLIKSKDKTISSCSIHNDTEYICSNAFNGCENLTGITIPKNIKGIGTKAFYQCTAMTRINYNAKKTEVFASNVFSSAGSNGSGITATIGADVQEIPPYFSGWDGARGEKSKLIKVIFEQGSSCEKIGHNAFYCSPTLQSIELPESVVTISKSAFISCTALKSIVIPNSVKEIGEFAFQGCSALTNLTLGNEIETIGTSAFINCTGLSNVTIPSTIRNIGNSVFSSCTSLRNVTIMQGATCIGTNMFSGCSSLANIEIPNSVIEVGSRAFSGCTSLVCNEYDNAYYVGTDSNPYLILINAKGQEISSCIVHQDTKFIEAYAFQNCKALTTVKLGNNITNIGFKAFDGCTKLEGVYINSLDNWCGVVFESQTSNPVAIAENLYINEQLVVDLVIPASIKEIGDYAFFGCTSIKSIKIPSNVTSIGINAFYNCSNITSVYIDDIAKWCSISFGSGSSNPLYYGDLYIEEQKTENLVIPDGVTEITKAAFAGCKTIQTVALPSTVVHIGEGAFLQCANLREINLPDSIVSMDTGVFGACEQLNSITIPKNITYIPKYTFAGCGALKQIALDKDSKLLLIGEESFAECRSLENIIIPTGVAVRIGNGAFSNCTNLLNVELGDDVRSIDSSAFNNCTNLKDLTIGNRVTHIGSSAFAGCTNLSDITIPDSVTSIGGGAFRGCTRLEKVIINNSVTFSETSHIWYGWFENCTSLTNVTLPDGLTTIPYATFDGCSQLTSINIPNSVTEICGSAFNGCIGLTNITIPDGVTSIGDSAFYGCSSLASITIPDTVTRIEENTFCGCTSLESVTIGNGVVAIEQDAFKDCANISSVYIKNLEKWCSITFSVTYGNQYRNNHFYSNPLCYGADLYINDKLVTTLQIPESIETIPYGTFYGCNSIQNVILPDSVKKVEYLAFSNCINLTSVKMGDVYFPRATYTNSNYAFEGCHKLIEVITNMTSTGSWLEESKIDEYVLDIHDGQTKIKNVGDYLFYACNDTNYLIGYIGESTNLMLPEKYNGQNYQIYKYALQNFTNIESVTLSNYVDGIGYQAFANCTGLKHLIIPEGVSTINNYAFSNCTNLTIYCKVDKQPNSWESNWNSSVQAIYWGYTGASITYDFEVNGGGSVEAITSVLSISLPTANKEGYYFAGWYDNIELDGSPVISPYYSSTLTTLYAKWLTEDEYFDGSSFDRAINLSLDTPTNVNIETAGEKVYYAFTPSETRSYIISSQGGLDTYGYLYDASKTQLSQNDGSTDFSMSYTLTAGTTYYVMVRMYSSSSTGSFTISVV